MAKPGTILTVLILALGAGSLSSAQQGWELGKQRYRFSFPVLDYEICIVNQAGWMRCIRKQQIRERLAADLTAKESRLVMGVMDEINAGTGNNRESDILVHCMGGWRGAKAAAMPAFDSRPGGGTRRGSMLEERIAQGRRDAVRSSCTSGRQPGTPISDSGNARQIDRAKARFQAAIDGCQDRMSSVADRSAGEGRGRVKSDRPAWEGRGRDETKGKSVLDNGSQREREEERRRATESGQDGSGPGLRGDIVNSVMFHVEGAAAAGLQADEVAALDKAQAAQRQKTYEQELAEDERSAEEQEEGQCLVDGQCTEAATNVKMPLPPGGEGPSTCAEQAARWKAFSDRCDGSEWQSWECASFLRFMNGCIDPTRIYPGPDGDLTCPASDAADPEERRRAAECRKLGMIALLTPEGHRSCGRAPPLMEKPRLGIDVCTDPEARGNPDRPDPGRPNPGRPIPDECR